MYINKEIIKIIIIKKMPKVKVKVDSYIRKTIIKMILVNNAF